jgi:hypothetical protein
MPYFLGSVNDYNVNIMRPLRDGAQCYALTFTGAISHASKDRTTDEAPLLKMDVPALSALVGYPLQFRHLKRLPRDIDLFRHIHVPLHYSSFNPTIDFVWFCILRHRKVILFPIDTSAAID